MGGCFPNWDIGLYGWVSGTPGFGGTIFFNRDLGVQERQGSIAWFFHCEFDVGVSAVDMVGEFLHMVGV